MICTQCRKAGSLNAAANAESDPAVAKRLLSRAKACHKKCLYKGCVCQHLTGDHINHGNRDGLVLMRGNGG